MRRRLFWKILLAFWGTFLAISYGLWAFWALAPARFSYDWDAPHAVGEVLATTAATVLSEEGMVGLRRYMSKWPPAQRDRLTVSPLPGAPCTPPSGSEERAIARPVTVGTSGYCLRYDTPPLPGEDEWMILGLPVDGMVAAALAGLAFSAALAWYIASPIRRLRRGFDRLAGGELDARLGPSMGRRTDEVADLARDFDRMAERLQELVGARDRLLHDVSHELRSPLARMRVATGLLRRYPDRLDASLDRIDREADQLNSLLGELLTLAKLESGEGETADYFDVLDVLRMVLEDLEFEAAASGVSVKTSLPETADNTWLVRGRGVMVHRAVENVVRNALRFSKAGQTIAVTLQKTTANHCAIVVEDEGPGIDQSGAANLLRPFVQGIPRADGAGFGLGLAIAHRAVATCGGRIELENRSSIGLRVTIALPLAEAQEPFGEAITSEIPHQG